VAQLSRGWPVIRRITSARGDVAIIVERQHPSGGRVQPDQLGHALGGGHLVELCAQIGMRPFGRGARPWVKAFTSRPAASAHDDGPALAPRYLLREQPPGKARCVGSACASQAWKASSLSKRWRRWRPSRPRRLRPRIVQPAIQLEGVGIDDLPAQSAALEQWPPTICRRPWGRRGRRLEGKAQTTGIPGDGLWQPKPQQKSCRMAPAASRKIYWPRDGGDPCPHSRRRRISNPMPPSARKSTREGSGASVGF